MMPFESECCKGSKFLVDLFLESYTRCTTHNQGRSPTVRPVRFWPDHFFLGAHPLLVKAWDWHLQRNRQKLNVLIINTSLEKKISFSVSSALFLLKVLILTGSQRGVAMARYVWNRPYCKICMSDMMIRSQPAIMPVLKGIQDLPNSPNQQTSWLQFTFKIVQQEN